MTIGSLLYFGALALWSAVIAYSVLERFFPFSSTPNKAPAVIAPPPSAPPSFSTAYEATNTVPNFNPNEGFKSFQRGKELTVEDIVTGLSRS